MKLLEKDIHEKQATIASLQKQLDEIKLINLEMFKKLQVYFIFLILRQICTRTSDWYLAQKVRLLKAFISEKLAKNENSVGDADAR